jgi:hypothetical protein
MVLSKRPKVSGCPQLRELCAASVFSVPQRNARGKTTFSELALRKKREVGLCLRDLHYLL